MHITDRLSASISQLCSQLAQAVETAANGDMKRKMLNDIIDQLQLISRQCRERIRRLFEGTLQDNIAPSATDVASGKLEVEAL